ncbi:MAG: hypothetical protein SGPRY_013687, partial [Prymnesium sp.]
AALSSTPRLPRVGEAIELEETRSFGPWWRAGRLRQLLRSLREPRSEAGFNYAAVNRPGRVLFAEKSESANGVVQLNRHGAWVCLMTDDIEQGLAYFDPTTNKLAAEVLGYQYLRVMAAAALGFWGLGSVGTARSEAPADPPRLLCVGLGTGALPGFLAHQLDGASVEVVEIDRTIVRAAGVIGCEMLQGGIGATEEGARSSGFSVVLGDAAEHVGSLRGGELSAIFVDAFDGNGETPSHLLQPPFLSECREALAPSGVRLPALVQDSTHLCTPCHTAH